MMTDKFPIKLLMLALLVSLALWAAFNGGGRSSLEQQKADALTSPNSSIASVIQPIAQANADAGDPGVVSGQIYAQQKNSETEFDARSNADLKARFKQANTVLSSGQVANAIERLDLITQDYPGVVEPYLNLAAIYADQNDLDMARKTLMRGIDANQKAGLLFAGLKEVHGAIAASAYRQALDTTSESVAVKASLPRVDTVVTRFDLSRELQSLKAQLENEANSESRFSETQKKQVAELNEKLLSIEKSKAGVEAQFTKEIAVLNAQLAEQSQALLVSQTAQREAEARVVRALQDAESQVAELKVELAGQQQSLDETQALLSSAQDLAAQQTKTIAQAEQQAQSLVLVKQDFDAAQQALGLLRKENQELKLQQQNAIAVQLAQVEQIQAERAQSTKEQSSQARIEQARLAKIEAEKQAQKRIEQEQQVATQLASQEAQQAQDAIARREQNAIARIKSWASAWSAQDVSGYVSHYADNYSSSRSITREQWLEQRQVRLTNKTFINVNVSGFDIKDLGQQFSVTFDQHYQSNTVDDTVRKRLVFDKLDDDWANAKIVNERLVPKRKS